MLFRSKDGGVNNEIMILFDGCITNKD